MTDSIQERFDNLPNGSRIAYLIGGFLTRTLTIAEEEELDAFIIESEDNMQIFEDMTDEPMIKRFLTWLDHQDK